MMGYNPQLNRIPVLIGVARFSARRDTKYTSIHDAVKFGDVRELEAMVKQGASVNEVDATKDRFTPMHWACHRGALEVSRLIHVLCGASSQCTRSE